MTLHEELEAELAAFKGTEAVLTFQSGFTANTGVIPTITGEADLIVSDGLNHASIIDGMRLSKAPRKIYPHADVGALERDPPRGTRDGPRRDGALSPDPRRHRRRLLHGRRHRAPARRSWRRPRTLGAAVFVDDAHASGVLGRNGRGSVDHFGLTAGSRSRSGRCRRPSASLGGYVAGSQDLRDILVQRARPFLFSTSHPPAVAAACREAIRVMQEEPG